MKKNIKNITRKKVVKKEKINQEKSLKLSKNVKNVDFKLNKFSDLVKKINEKNSLRPYPDINDIPN